MCRWDELQTLQYHFWDICSKPQSITVSHWTYYLNQILQKVPRAKIYNLLLRRTFSIFVYCNVQQPRKSRNSDFCNITYLRTNHTYSFGHQSGKKINRWNWKLLRQSSACWGDCISAQLHVLSSQEGNNFSQLL